MSSKLDLERLRGRSLFVGTPMYSGQCCSQYAFAIAQLSALCAQLGIALRFYFPCHEALVTKARNVTADAFLRSGDEHLLLVDADTGFNPRDAIHLMALQALEGDEGGNKGDHSGGDGAFDVLAAPCPLKHLAWDNLREAVRRGLADDDAGALARYASNIDVYPAAAAAFPLDRPVEVVQAGTGFMMIRRATLERYRQAYPTRRYRPEQARMKVETSPEIHAFFETEIDSKESNLLAETKAFLARFPQATHAQLLAFLEREDAATGEYSGRHISEDYAFCRRVRAAGMRVWLCPWVELTHVGTYAFTSRLPDLAAIGAV